MLCPEDAATARLRAWGVADEDNLCSNLEAVETAAYYDDTPTRIISERGAKKGVKIKGRPGPLAIYVDNLKCHVSTEAQDAFATWGTEVVPLPKNTTSVLQPLDVGVMGPFNQKLRAITLSYELSAVRESNRVPLCERLLKLQRLPAPEKRKRLVERVVAAWNAVSESSIKKVWSKAGL
uniref:DDE-1 domain-containing protein n=1 Tax=Phytophthora ramorum TaxID=164328 RepID=H3H0V4_PHYRM